MAQSADNGTSMRNCPAPDAIIKRPGAQEKTAEVLIESTVVSGGEFGI